MVGKSLLVLFLTAAIQSATFAQEAGKGKALSSVDCPIPVGTPEQAMAKADWVIEGTLMDFISDKLDNLIINQSRAA